MRKAISTLKKRHGPYETAIHELRLVPGSINVGDPIRNIYGVLSGISEFFSVGPLLANSDYIGTFPSISVAWDMEIFGLQPLQPQIPLPPFRTRFFWSSRLANDPASRWRRDIVLETYREMHVEAENEVSGARAASSD